MPCYDSRDHQPARPMTREEQLAQKMPAVLCGLVRAIGLENAVQAVDWKQAGVTPQEFRQWWDMHNARDYSQRF